MLSSFSSIWEQLENILKCQQDLTAFLLLCLAFWSRSLLLASIPVSGNHSWNSDNSRLCFLPLEILFNLRYPHVSDQKGRTRIHGIYLKLSKKRRGHQSASRNTILQPFLVRGYITAVSVMNCIFIAETFSFYLDGFIFFLSRSLFKGVFHPGINKWYWNSYFLS